MQKHLCSSNNTCYTNRDVSNSPSTHSCSMSVSMAATLSPTERAPNTKSPIKRTFPQCLWMWQPRENRRAWNLARIHRGAFWPTAFPWIWSRREGEKRTVLLLPCYHLLYTKRMNHCTTVHKGRLHSLYFYLCLKFVDIGIQWTSKTLHPSHICCQRESYLSVGWSLV